MNISKAVEPIKHEVIAQDWVEDDCGFGIVPYGRTLHLLIADRDAFVKDHQDGFSWPDNEPYKINVGTEVFEQVKASINGVFI